MVYVVLTIQTRYNQE